VNESQIWGLTAPPASFIAYDLHAAETTFTKLLLDHRSVLEDCDVPAGRGTSRYYSNQGSFTSVDHWRAGVALARELIRCDHAEGEGYVSGPLV
jgi:hypothetical protein